MNIQTTPFKYRALAVAAVAALGLSACGSDDDADNGDGTEQSADGISMTDPWSRQPAEGQTTSAVYGELTNNTDQAITAVAAATSVTDSVELHEVLMNDEGQMTMQEKEGGYEIAAGETFVFEPGGPHIMLLDIDPTTYPETVQVTLSFDNETSIDFTAEVREIGDDAMGDMSMDEMEDGDGMVEMEDGDMGEGHSDDAEMDEMEDGDMDEESSEG